MIGFHLPPRTVRTPRAAGTTCAAAAGAIRLLLWTLLACCLAWGCAELARPTPAQAARRHRKSGPSKPSPSRVRAHMLRDSEATGEPNVPWGSFPQPDTAGLAKSGSQPATDDPNAEVLLDDDGINFGADGSIAATSFKAYLVKSREAGEKLQQLPAAPPGPGNSTVAFLLHPDGRQEAALSVRNGVARFEAVVPGDVVVARLQIYTPPRARGVRDEFSASNALRGSYTVRRARFWVRYPAGRPPGLRAVALGAPQVTTEGAMTVQQWTAASQPALMPEKASMGAMDATPAVFVDAHNDLDWLQSVCRGYLRLPAGQRLQALAAQLQGEAANPEALMLRARTYVALQIKDLPRESAVPDSLRRLTPDGVIRRGAAGAYGKTVLLAGLLRRLGFDPGIALVDPQRLWRKPPVLAPGYVFPVVAEPWDRPRHWLLPSSAYAPSDRVEMSLQGLTGVVIGPQRTLPEASIPVAPPEQRGLSATVTGTVDSSGVIAGQMELRFQGSDADLWRATLQTATQADAAQAMQDLSADLLAGAEVQGTVAGEGFDQLADQVSMSAKFRARDLLDRSGMARRLKLAGGVIPDLERAPRTTTRSLLRLFGPHEVRDELVLPAGWSPASAAGVDSIGTSGRYLAWNETRRVSGGKLTVTRRVSVLQSELPAADLKTYLDEQDAKNRAFDRPVEFRTQR